MFLEFREEIELFLMFLGQMVCFCLPLGKAHAPIQALIAFISCYFIYLYSEVFYKKIFQSLTKTKVSMKQSTTLK